MNGMTNMLVEMINREDCYDHSSLLLHRPRSSRSGRNYFGKKRSFTLRRTFFTICFFWVITFYTSTLLTAINEKNMISYIDQDTSMMNRETSLEKKNIHPVNAPDYPEYNEDEALEQIYYSKAAFCTEQAIKSWSCGDMCDKAPVVGNDTIRYIPEGERFKVQAYVAQIPVRDSVYGQNLSSEDLDNTEDVKCMIAFRGSLNGANWYADFLTMLRPWPINELFGADWCRGCKAHYGFTEAYEELRPSIHGAVEDLNCTRLVIAGHSLGAAIATIASFELRAAMGYKVDATWTFGQPRIGNAEFVESFEAAAARQGTSPPVWRVVHYHDPVPRAPPHFPGIHPVTHGSLEIYYTDRASSEYIICPQHGSVENKSEACMGGWPLYLPVNMDHVTYLNQSFAFKDLPVECKT